MRFNSFLQKSPVREMAVANAERWMQGQKIDRAALHNLIAYGTVWFHVDETGKKEMIDAPQTQIKAQTETQAAPE